MKRRGMSAVVLKRKRERRTGRLFAGLLCLEVVVLCAGTGYHAYEQRKQSEYGAVGAESRIVWAANSTDGRLPGLLYISGERWSVLRVDRFPGRDDIIADTDCANHVIHYKMIGEATLVLRESLWHEIFHAGACVHTPKWWNSESDEDNGHIGVHHLGMFMASFARDNPEFVSWASQ